VDQHVCDSVQGHVVQRLEGTYAKDSNRALSGDGKWFAVTSERSEKKETLVRITVWHTPSGEVLCTVPECPREHEDIVLFSQSRYLMVGGLERGQLDVWDLESREQLAPIAIPVSPYINKNSIALTPDGECVATTDPWGEHLVLCNVKSGQTIAELDCPLEMLNYRQSRLSAARGQPSERKPDTKNARSIYKDLKAIEFSPDGQEIAAFSVFPCPRLLCWNRQGKLVFDEPIGVSRMSPVMERVQYPLQWLPDGSGWQVGGVIFDRKSKRPLMRVRSKQYDFIVQLLDGNRLLTVYGDALTEINVLEIPWTRLRQSLSMIEDGTPAPLRPDRPISVNLEFGTVLGDAEETKQRLMRTVTAQLAANGLRVEEGQATVLRMRFEEKAGKTLPIHERRRLSDPNFHDTGRTMTERHGVFVMVLTTEGCNRPLWQRVLQGNSTRGFVFKEINEKTIRDSMMSSICSSVSTTDFPYFVPATEEHLALPVVIE